MKKIVIIILAVCIYSNSYAQEEGNSEENPEEIKSIHNFDFSDYNLSETKILKNHKYAPMIQKIAETIYEHIIVFKEQEESLCKICDGFKLLSDEAIKELKKRFSISTQT